MFSAGQAPRSLLLLTPARLRRSLSSSARFSSR